MSSLRKIVALMLLPVLVAGVFIFIVGTALDGVFLSGASITAKLRDADAYTVVVREAIHAIETQQQKQPAEATGISGNDLTAVATTVLDPTWLQQEVEANVTRLDRWLNKGQTLELAVDTTNRKPVLIDALNELLDQQFSSLPRCAPAATFHSLNDLCVPEGMTREEFRAEMKKMNTDIAAIVGALPDRIDLLNPQSSISPFLEKIGGTPAPTSANATSVAKQLDGFRESVLSYRSGMRLLLIGIIALLGIECVLLAFGRKAFFRWTSLVMIVTATMPTAVGALGLLGAGSFIDQRITESVDSLLPETKHAIDVLTTNLIASVFLPILIAGVVLFAVGICLGIASSMTRVPKRT